jgi:hypothetical protein
MLSGKSVLLAALRRGLTGEALTVDYGPKYWPKAAAAPAQTHLGQILQLAGRDLRGFFYARPEKLDLLSGTQRQFMRWLAERFDGEHAYLNWLGSLPKAQDELMRPVEKREDPPPSLVENESAPGQIEDLISLCRRVGFRQVVIFVDVPAILSAEQVQQLDRFFEGLELMHHDGLRCVSAVNTAVQAQEGFIRKARGRMQIIPVTPNEERTFALTGKHLVYATGGSISALGQLVEPGLLQLLRRMIQEEFGGPMPGAWVQLAGILLPALAQSGAAQLGEAAFPALRQIYYKKYLPLYIPDQVTRPGVWRGARFITMESEPFAFLKKVHSFKGRAVDFKELHLSKTNTHTLAHRARVLIEPDPENPLYLHNRRNEGYWLENCV